MKTYERTMLDVWYPVYDEVDPKDPDPKDPDPKDPDPKKGFTQDQVNAIVAKEKAKVTRGYESRITELETLKESSNLSAKEVETLNNQIEEMRTATMTKQELSKTDREKERAASNKTLKATETDRDLWKSKYTDSTIQRSLIDAAVAVKAYSPDQVVSILRPDTRLTDELDAEGKATGNMVPKVSYMTTDEKGKALKLELSPAETVKKMMEEDRFANLFISDKTSGLNLNNKTKGGKDNKTVPTGTSEYMEWRKNQKKK